MTDAMLDPQGEETTLEIPNLPEALEAIDGYQIESALVGLASINGELLEPRVDQPERYAASRLALTEADKRGRSEFVKPWMERLGMDTIDHPLATIGILKGSNPELAPVVVISHTDSVPRADMYDGDVGVVGGITAIEALQSSDVTLKRTVMVVSVTGEESSRFGMALFGSKGLFLGLTGQELALKDADGVSMAEAVGEENIDRVKRPLFGPVGDELPTPHAVIELHVEQNDSLEKAGLDLGVVEAIAAPVRFAAKIGETPLEVEPASKPFNSFLEIAAQGKADHSGATPMGEASRADGLVASAELMMSLMAAAGDSLRIGAVTIDDQAINKIPGCVRTTVRLEADTQQELDQLEVQLIGAIDRSNAAKNSVRGGRFDENPFSVNMVPPSEAGDFYSPEINNRYNDLFKAVVQTKTTAERVGQGTVGTIGTVKCVDGVLDVGVDVRGIEKAPRDDAIKDIKHHASGVIFGKALSGSGDPVSLDQRLVVQVKRIIDSNDLGSSIVMPSAAGHDAQNAARAGIPTVMIFVPSENGVAHNPEAYTSPEHLQKGVQALTASVAMFANQ